MSGTSSNYITDEYITDEDDEMAMCECNSVDTCPPGTPTYCCYSCEHYWSFRCRSNEYLVPCPDFFFDRGSIHWRPDIYLCSYCVENPVDGDDDFTKYIHLRSDDDVEKYISAKKYINF